MCKELIRLHYPLGCNSMRSLSASARVAYWSIGEVGGEIYAWPSVTAGGLIILNHSTVSYGDRYRGCEDACPAFLKLG